MASRTRRTKINPSSIVLAASQLPPSQPSPHAATPVVQNTSVAVVANQVLAGIEVPDYDIKIGQARVARGRHTRLVTQDYIYDDKKGTEEDEYREFLHLYKMAAAVLPMCPNESKYLLIRQFRYPAWHNALRDASTTPTEDGWLYEVIAGVIEQGDTPEQTVIREAKEEGDISIDSNNIRKVHECMMTPGITNEVISIFLAIVNQTSPIGNTGLTDEGEHIRAKWMTADEIRHLHSHGLIRDAKTLIALYAARVL